MKDLPELNEKMNFLGKISSWLIDRYRIVYLMIILMVGLGLTSYIAMPKESFPDIEINYVFVVTSYPGASVQDVESLVTNEVEAALESVDGMLEIKSTTNAGFSRVNLKFDENADMKQAKLDVQTIVNDINFPDGVTEPRVIQMETGEIPIMNLTLTGEYDLIELNNYAELLQSKFEKLSGVKNVDVSGSKEREIRVSVDQNLLYEYGITTKTISNALATSNVQLPLGNTSLDHISYSIRVDESFKTIDELESTVLSSGPQGTIFLSDVATITDSYKTPDSEAYTYTREYSAEEKATPVITLSIFRETGADIIGISNQVKAVIGDVQGSSIPEDLNVIITSDESEEVTENLNTVLASALGGLLVVVAVLFIFIGLNESIIVALVIPLSLLISLTIMELAGITINSLSLVGFVVALGLLVDNAIVVMENIDRFRDEGLDRITASKIGSNQVGPAVLAATVTTVGAFIPLALQSGSIGQMISILPKTLIITILSSFFVSIAVTPNLSSRLLSKYKKEEQVHDKKRDVASVLFVLILVFIAFLDNWMITPWAFGMAIVFASFMVFKIMFRRRKEANRGKGLEKPSYIDSYVSWLQQFFDSRVKRWMVFLVAFFVLVGAITTIPVGILELELMPAEEPNGAIVSITAPEGYLLSDTYEIAELIEAKLYDMEDMESFDIVVGGNKKNEGNVTVNFVDSEFRKIDGFENVDNIREIIKTIPGAEFDVKPIATDLGPGSSGEDIAASVMGDNLTELNAVANQYLAVLKEMEGIDSPTISSQDGVKEITVEIDKNKASYYGLSISQIASELRQRISGLTAGSYEEAGESYDITIYHDEKPIDSVSELETIFFTNNKGQKVPFAEIASLSYSEGMAQISHEGGRKVVTVSANVQSGYNATTIGKEFDSKLRNIPLPAGVESSSGGQFKDTQEQTSKMINSFALALFIVYMALVIQFNSFIQPFVILMSVPFALIGIIFGLIVTGNNMGIYAMMGTVSLVGIAVNDAIVLIDFANYQRSIGKDIREAITDAVKIRFLPVLATSLTTMGGVLPLALYNDSFSQLGFAIVFGLFASTVLTLLIIPLMYYMIEITFERNKAKKKTRTVEKEDKRTNRVLESEDVENA